MGDPTLGLPLLLTTPLWEWRLGSGDRTELGSSDPRALCQPAVLDHPVAHGDAAQRWGEVHRCIWLSFLRLHPSTAFWTLVDHDGYSISSKGFLPAVVDIMVI